MNSTTKWVFLAASTILLAMPSVAENGKPKELAHTTQEGVPIALYENYHQYKAAMKSKRRNDFLQEQVLTIGAEEFLTSLTKLAFETARHDIETAELFLQSAIDVAANSSREAKIEVAIAVNQFAYRYRRSSVAEALEFLALLESLEVEAKSDPSFDVPIFLPSPETAVAAMPPVGDTYRPIRPKPATYPVLAWPLPKPSTKVRLAEASDHFRAQKAGFEEVYGFLETELVAAGYDDLAVHMVENGFAIITRVEQITKEASPKAKVRWQLGERLSFFEALGSLFVGQRGYYRHIVILVAEPYLVGDYLPSYEQVSSAFNGGWNTLPMSLENGTFTDRHSIDALVYQFERNEDSGKMFFVESPANNAKEHLWSSGLTGFFGRALDD